MASCISLDHVSKSFGSTLAVNDLSLEIEQGEIFGLLGPNGAGKSTTFYLMCGLARPASGKDGNPHQHYQTVRGAVTHCNRHEAFHAGQLALIRRLLGKPFLR